MALPPDRRASSPVRQRPWIGLPAILALSLPLPGALAQAVAELDDPAPIEELMEEDPFGEVDAGEGESPGEEDAGDDDRAGGAATRVRPPPSRTRLLPIDMKIDRRAPIPPASPFHMGREIAQTMHYTGAPWLVRESRQREEDCRQMLDALGVKEGQTVCDLGAGNGFYTLELARLVGPEGLVYAVDIQPQMLRMLSRRAAQEGLSNIRLVLGSPVDPRLPAGAVDLVLCVDVYHEFSHPEPMLARIRESLSPEGRVALVEFRGEDPAVPIKPLHKMTKAQVRAELEPAGFRLAGSSKGSPGSTSSSSRRPTDRHPPDGSADNRATGAKPGRGRGGTGVGSVAAGDSPAGLARSGDGAAKCLSDTFPGGVRVPPPAPG